MRLFKATIIAVAALFLSAAMASAVVTVTSTQSGTSWAIGDQMTITVTVTSDENLTDLNFSAMWDSSQWGSPIGTANQATIWNGLFYNSTYSTSYPTGGLLRTITPFCAVIDDCNSELRLVQYSSGLPNPGPGLPPGGYYYGIPGSQTFRLKLTAVGPGTSDIVFFQNTGDIIQKDGVNVAFNSSNTTGVTVIPEPGTALLMGLGLVGLGVAGRRNR
jgi:hypothetical protein